MVTIRTQDGLLGQKEKGEWLLAVLPGPRLPVRNNVD